MSFQLQTERLALTPVISEVDQTYRILTDESVRKYLCDDTILPREQIEEFVADSQQSFAEKGFGLWLIHHGEEMIGLAGLRIFFDEGQPQLLYALLPAFTGKGFATEASAAIIEYCFGKLSFSYLDASCDEPNAESHKVATRLGMKFLKKEEIVGRPTVFYRIKNK